MNSEELKTEFGLEFPTEIDGYKRPDEPLDSGHDWFMEIPQLIAKDKVLYTGMNLILSALLSNEKLLKQWHDTLQNVVSAQDWRVVTDSLKGYMTPELKKKLDGIATGANNYVHPSTHPATMITQDATHRFVTDTEKTTWNGKASTAVVSTTANGLAPKRDGNASHFLAGDGTWKVVPSASSATSATKATQDSRGQQIDTTYIKEVTGSNATLTVTKGNGTTSTTTINNVANATNAKIVSNTAGDGSATDLVTGTMASNDYFRIRIGGSSDAGYAEIATADNGNEPIYIRQYGGSNFGFSEPIRTATILDSSGNTSFPGKVTASGGFSGNLTGNATSATKATNDSSNRNIVNTYATKESPAFSGTPTAPTPGTTDNSTRIATTAFVRSLLGQRGNTAISKNKNGWWKDNNTGLLIQWGTITAGDIENSYIVYGEGTFPLTFSTVFQVVVCHQGGAPTGNCISYLSNNKIKIKLGTNGVTPQYTPWDCRYIAIGVA